jgi:ABC-type phosphate/phosphonate transport system substrate-binding protein
VDRETARKFTEIVLSLKKTKEGRAVIEKTGWPGFKAATPREYDVMEPYAKFIKY